MKSWPSTISALLASASELTRKTNSRLSH